MNSQKIDLTGQRFGSWTVLSEAPARSYGNVTMWLCQCDCGTIREVNGQLLRDGRSKSCGCRKTKLFQEWHRKVGHNTYQPEGEKTE